MDNDIDDRISLPELKDYI